MRPGGIEIADPWRETSSSFDLFNELTQLLLAGEEGVHVFELRFRPTDPIDQEQSHVTA